MKYPNIIYWVKPGYYYFNNGWKHSSDQSMAPEHGLRKYFDSEKQAKDFGLKIQK